MDLNEAHPKRELYPTAIARKVCTWHQVAFSHTNTCTSDNYFIPVPLSSSGIFHAENRRNGMAATCSLGVSPNMVNLMPRVIDVPWTAAISHRMSHSAKSVERCAQNIICNPAIGLAGSVSGSSGNAAARNCTALPFLNQGAR